MINLNILTYFLLIASLIWRPVAHAIELPEIGEASEKYLSHEEEQRLGEAFMRNIRHSLTINNDLEINGYIQSLGTRLVSNGGIRNGQYTFFIVNDPKINAFAGPGGHIGINSGLVLMTESEAELASVLAHEIAHVSQKHLARAYEAASKMSLPVTAAIIAAIILGNKHGQLGEATLAAATAGSVQSQINFTRDNEKEADRVGLQILADSNYDPREMPNFFKRLLRTNRLSDDQQIEFLQTHPVTTSRISDTLNRAEMYPSIAPDTGYSYILTKEKLRILTHPNLAETLNYYTTLLKNPKQKEKKAIRYGYALSLLKTGEIKQARKIVNDLIKEEPDIIAFQIAKAEIEKQAGNITKVIHIYKDNLSIYPHNHALTLLYVSSLLENGQAKEARKQLLSHLRLHESNPEIYRLLAQAEDKSGRLAESHQALAEYYYLIGDTTSAIKQLEISLKFIEKNDFHNLEKTNARINQLKNEFLIETGRKN